MNDGKEVQLPPPDLPQFPAGRRIAYEARSCYYYCLRVVLLRAALRTASADSIFRYG